MNEVWCSFEVDFQQNFGSIVPRKLVRWRALQSRTIYNKLFVFEVGLALVKAVVLRININLDGESIRSKSHTHPSHSQTSRLLTSSLSLGVPVPRPTQCVRGA